MSIISSFVIITWVIPIISKIFLFFDCLIFALLQGAIQVFFEISNLTVDSLSDLLGNLFSTITAIVLIYIIFRISILLLQYLMNPENFKDKQKGGEKLLKNFLVSMVMLVLLESNLLFGFFNDLQKLVFSNGTVEYEVFDVFGVTNNVQNKEDMIGKLIFGDNNNYSHQYMGTNIQAHDIAVAVFQQFLYIEDDNGNPTPWAQTEPIGGPNDLSRKVRTVADNFGTGFSFFWLLDANLGLKWWGSAAKTRYICLVSSIFGIYMLLTFLKYAIKLVVRVLKLIVLQIVSPVFIVSYAVPDGKKDFDRFWKNYFSTYFELFIRLFVVYISIYILGLVFSDAFLATARSDMGFGIVRLVFRIILLLGVLEFMKIAPPFIAKLFGQDLEQNDTNSLKIMQGVAGATVTGAAGIFNGVKDGIKTGTYVAKHAPAPTTKEKIRDSVVLSAAGAAKGAIKGAFSGGYNGTQSKDFTTLWGTLKGKKDKDTQQFPSGPGQQGNIILDEVIGAIKDLKGGGKAPQKTVVNNNNNNNNPNYKPNNNPKP